MKITGFFLTGGMLCAALLTSCSSSQKGYSSGLDFDPENYKLGELVMPGGDTVKYKAYEGIFYVRT